MTTTPDQVAEALLPYGVRLSPGQVDAVRQYVDLLLLWNQKINLTRIVRPQEILARHFGESMFAAEIAGIFSGRLADVGSGAGFPGLALKIVRPELHVTLIEGNAKKGAFLGEVIRKLGLTGVEILRQRMEQTESRAWVELVTARAVGNLGELLEWSAVALAPRGRLLLWIGAADARGLTKGMSRWSWEEPIPIPKSSRTFLLVGSPTRKA